MLKGGKCYGGKQQRQEPGCASHGKITILSRMSSFEPRHNRAKESFEWCS